MDDIQSSLDQPTPTPSGSTDNHRAKKRRVETAHISSEESDGGDSQTAAEVLAELEAEDEQRERAGEKRKARAKANLAGRLPPRTHVHDPQTPTKENPSTPTIDTGIQRKAETDSVRKAKGHTDKEKGEASEMEQSEPEAEPDSKGITSKEKGKGKMMESADTDSDSDSDLDFYIPPPPPKPMWITTGDWPSPRFDDYLEPFGNLGHTVFSDGWKEAMKALIGRKKYSLLVSASSNMKVEAELLQQGIVMTLGRENAVKEVRSPFAGATWVVMELIAKEDVERLLERRHIYHPQSPLLITFRRIEKNPMPVRTLTVFQVPPGEAEEVSKEIARVAPPPHKVKVLSCSKVTRKNPNAPSTLDMFFELEIPEDLQKSFERPLKLANRWRVRKGPHCTICNSDNHLREACWWYGDLSNKNVGFEKRKLGSKPRGQ
jgi:hypothetical protein